MPPTLQLTPGVARQFHRRAVLLDRPAASLASALDHHGYVQIDPINVCGRMHDLILRNRVQDYAEGGLMRHLHGDDDTPLTALKRTAFEHHLPSTSILVAFPLAAWPHLLARMQARAQRSGAWSGRLTPREKALSVEILAEMEKRGPLASDDIENDQRASRHVWGRSSLAKSTLQKLFFHGRILIISRPRQRRKYHLPAHVLPESMLRQSTPSAAETQRWSIWQRLKQHRLVILRRGELPLVEDLVAALSVDGCPLLHCLREDLSLLDTLGETRPDPPTATRLLAPLDPLIYDRRVTSALWGFDYTWEVYTPAAKRVRGYYALPILHGTELVGHVDAKADRTARKLRVEQRSIRRGYRSADATRQLARFLGLRA